MTSVHDGIVFQCPLCDHENFTTKQGLRKHLRLQHDDVEDPEKILANSKVESIQETYSSSQSTLFILKTKNYQRIPPEFLIVF